MPWHGQATTSNYTCQESANAKGRRTEREELTPAATAVAKQQPPNTSGKRHTQRRERGHQQKIGGGGGGGCGGGGVPTKADLLTTSHKITKPDPTAPEHRIISNMTRCTQAILMYAGMLLLECSWSAALGGVLLECCWSAPGMVPEEKNNWYL